MRPTFGTRSGVWCRERSGRSSEGQVRADKSTLAASLGEPHATGMDRDTVISDCELSHKAAQDDFIDLMKIEPTHVLKAECAPTLQF